MPPGGDMSIVIQAIDQASSVLRQVSGAVSSMAETSKSSLSAASSSIRSSMSVVKTTVDSAISSIGPVLVGAAKAGGVALLALGGYGLKTAADIEQTRIAFDVLTGSAEKGRQLMGDIVTMGAKTPFESWDLQKNAQLLLNYSVKMEDILPTLSMLGDISAGNAEKLGGLTLAFSQVSSKGRLTGQELLQMVSNGFNPLEMIAIKTGESMKDLEKRMEKGGISFKEVEEAMKTATAEGGRFYGMMAKQSNSVGGLASTLKDYLAISLNEIIGITKDGEVVPGSMFDSAKEAIKGLIDWIEKNKDALVKFGTTVGNIVVGSLSLLKNTLSSIIGFFDRNEWAIYAVGGAIVSVLIPSLIGLGTTLMTVTIPAILAIAAAFLPFIAIGAVIGAIIYGIKIAWENNFLGIRDIVASFISRISNTFLPFIQNIYTIVSGVFLSLQQRFTSSFLPAILSIRDGVVAVFNRALSMIMSIVDIFIGIFTGDWELLSQGIQGVRESLRQAIVTIFSIVREQIKVLRDFVVSYLSTAWTNLWTGVKNFFVGVWNSIKSTYTSAVEAIASFFGGGGRALIEQGFNAMVGGLVAIMKGVINGVIAGFEFMVNSGIDSINRLIEALNDVGGAVGISVSIPKIPRLQLPRFAFGGIVDGPNGIDRVPALLSPGELILNKAQQQNLAGQLQGGNGQTIYITFSPQIFGSKEGLAEEIMDSFMKQFRQHTRYESF